MSDPAEVVFYVGLGIAGLWLLSQSSQSAAAATLGTSGAVPSSPSTSGDQGTGTVASGPFSAFGDGLGFAVDPLGGGVAGAGSDADNTALSGAANIWSGLGDLGTAIESPFVGMDMTQTPVSVISSGLDSISGALGDTSSGTGGGIVTSSQGALGPTNAQQDAMAANLAMYNSLVSRFGHVPQVGGAAFNGLTNTEKGFAILYDNGVVDETGTDK